VGSGSSGPVARRSVSRIAQGMGSQPRAHGATSPFGYPGELGFRGFVPSDGWGRSPILTDRETRLRLAPDERPELPGTSRRVLLHQRAEGDHRLSARRPRRPLRHPQPSAGNGG
jgi:hypothetical protein